MRSSANTHLEPSVRLGAITLGAADERTMNRGSIASVGAGHKQMVLLYDHRVFTGKVVDFLLRDIGFAVKLKPHIQRSDGSAKGDWDVGIVLDMVELAEKVDTVVLASGDGDFDLAVLRIKQRFETKSEVYGVERLTAGSLIRAATTYVPIEEEFLMP